MEVVVDVTMSEGDFENGNTQIVEGRRMLLEIGTQWQAYNSLHPVRQNTFWQLTCRPSL